MKSRITYLAVLVFLINLDTYGKDYHVSVNGNDNNSGSLSKPFCTISAAAKIALPDDVITVHEGTYREWIRPVYGGINDLKRIIYQAAPVEKVIIKGSEIITNWKSIGNGVWKTTFLNSFLEEYYPFQEIIKGDWFSDKGRIHNTGEVYMNGKSLYEIDSLEKVKYPNPLKDAVEEEGSTYQWYCANNFETTTIWANFHDYNPAKGWSKENIVSNLYLNGAKPYKKETNGLVNTTLKPELRLEGKDNEVFLHINTDESFNESNCKIITTKLLGCTIQSEPPFENSDGTTIKFGTNYFGLKRNETNPGVGLSKILVKQK